MDASAELLKTIFDGLNSLYRHDANDQMILLFLQLL